MKNITISLNEQELSIRPTMRLFELASIHKPDADILVVNGFPAQHDCELQEGDTVTLIKRGDAPSEDELEALMAARHTPGIHHTLKQSRVGIAGLGGLGSTIAVSLARVGVGTLVLVDYDVVEPSNLNRQQYFVEQIGTYKTYALKALIQKINPFLNVICHTEKITPDNVVELFESVNVIVEALDMAETKTMFVENVLIHFPNKPIICGSGMAGFGDNSSLHTRQLGKLYICGDEQSEAGPGKGLMAPRVGIVANMQANQVMEVLLSGKESYM